MTDASRRAASGRAVPPLQRSMASLLTADFTVQSRNVRSLVLSLLLPLVFLFELSAGKRVSQLGGSEVRVAFCIMMGITTLAILGYSTSVARDRDAGVFQRLRVTPTSPWLIMVSRLIVQVVAILGMAAVVLIVAGVFEHVTLSPGAYVLTAIAVILGAAEFLGIGQSMVGFTRSAETLNAVGRFVYVPLFALGLFGHTDVLGTTFELISRWSPSGVVVTMLSGAMSPSTWNLGVWGAVLVSILYTVVFAGLGIRWFRWTSR